MKISCSALASYRKFWWLFLSDMGQQNTWAEVSVGGVGKGAEVQPEHTVTCPALRSVGQNQC